MFTDTKNSSELNFPLKKLKTKNKTKWETPNPKKLKENSKTLKEISAPEIPTKPMSKLTSLPESSKEELNKLILDKL